MNGRYKFWCICSVECLPTLLLDSHSMFPYTKNHRKSLVYLINEIFHMSVECVLSVVVMSNFFYMKFDNRHLVVHLTSLRVSNEYANYISVYLCTKYLNFLINSAISIRRTFEWDTLVTASLLLPTYFVFD